MPEEKTPQKESPYDILSLSWLPDTHCTLPIPIDRVENVEREGNMLMVRVRARTRKSLVPMISHETSLKPVFTGVDGGGPQQQIYDLAEPYLTQVVAARAGRGEYIVAATENRKVLWTVDVVTKQPYNIQEVDSLVKATADFIAVEAAIKFDSAAERLVFPAVPKIVCSADQTDIFTLYERVSVVAKENG